MTKFRNLFILLVSLCAACTLVGPALAQEDQGVTIRRVFARDFPKVNLVVSTHGLENVTTDDLSVTENGAPVESFDIQSLTSTGITIDTVLVIDTSGSMEGAPMAAAKSAAQRFVQAIPPEVGVGVVTFSDNPRVLVPVTKDHQAAAAAISRLTASGETAIYDGVITATKQFAPRAQKNMILLSDGGDTASNANLRQAIAAVKKSNAVVFPVGLETPETDIGTLRTLAARSGGRYSPAGEADLSGIYAGLAEEIEGQFILSYRSSAVPGEQTTIAVGSGSVSDSSLFLSPKVEVAKEPVTTSVDESTGFRPGLLLVIAFVFITVAFSARLLLDRRATKKRQRRLARQLATETQGQTETKGDEDAGLAGYIPSAMSTAAERLAEETRVADRIDRLLERAGVNMKLGEFMATLVLSSVASVLIGALLFDIGFFSFLFWAFVGAYVPLLWVSIKARRRSTKIKNQLADVLGILASSMRVGHSFLQSLDSVGKEIGEPASHEFVRAVAEIRLGRSPEDTLNDLADRVGSDDFKWAVLAANIQRDMGGNLAEVLDTVAKTVRDRDSSRRQIDALSAEGKYSAVILTILPFFMAGYMQVVNPESLALLFTTSLGRVMLVGGGFLLLAGILWMRKLVRIDV